MAGYVRQSVADIVTGEDIEAFPLNAEFNAIAGSFHPTTGHTHDGTTGNGPKITLTFSTSGILSADQGGTGGKNNINSVSNPTVTDDVTKGYVPGSLWVNTSSNQPFICVNNQTGAAIWNLIQAPTGTFLTPGNNLSDLNNLSTARSNLGVAIGTDVQAYSPKLNQVSGFSTVGGVPFVFNSTNYSFFNTTQFSRDLMANTAASNWKSSLGLNNVDNTSDVTKFTSTPLTGTPTAPTASAGTSTTQLATTAFVTTAVPLKGSAAELRALTNDTKFLTPLSVAGASLFTTASVNGSVVVDFSLNFNLSATLTGNTTLAAPTNAKEGLSGVFRLQQDSTGGRTLSFNSFWNFGVDGVPTLSTAANAVDYIFYTILPGATSAICSFKAGQ